MLRALLVGLLAISATGGCGSKHDAPQVDPAAPAGKVIEVTGKVMVGQKALAIGDAIKADDLIDTGDDGTVVIVLAHNDARWELGPKHKSKPSESLAWTAERSKGPAKAVEQDTSAAGRPAERSAADTATSAHGGESMKDTASRGVDRKLERQDSEAKPSSGAPMPATAEAPPPPPPPPPPTAQPIAPHADPMPPPKPSGGGSTDAKASKGGKEVAAAPAPQAAVSAPSAIDQLAALASCLPTGTNVRVKVHIAKRVPTITFEGAVDAKVKTCVTDAAKKLSLPIESGDMALTLRN